MNRKVCSLLLAGVVLAAVPALAGDGSFLHGVGAVNSAMGGAGTGLPNDSLGALNLNPALLTELPGSGFEFSAEYAHAENAVSSQAGPFAGRTEESGHIPLIPAFGFTSHVKDTAFAYGVGFLGIAGFGVDYPQDPNNPILAPQPHGFGRVYANYQFLKVPIVGALRLNSQWSVGAAVVTGRSSLTADPAGFAAPDCGPNGCFYPHVDTDSSFGIAGQVGVHYRINPVWAVGAAYTTEQKFQSFQWNSAAANPELPNFGASRHISFTLDSPPIATLGLGITPISTVKVAADVKWMGYGNTPGFSGTGVDPATGQLKGLGWRSVWVEELGLQLQATSMLTLRLGYNHAENAIPDSAAFLNVASPSIWGNHLCAGIGARINQQMSLDAAYYHAFKTSISSPFLGPAGPVPGTLVTDEMTMNSLIATFSFRL
jgi:long-chain fatty acid transport protein